MIFRTFLPKMAVFGGKMAEKVVRRWPQQTYSYFSGLSNYLCATFGENWSRTTTV